MVLGLSAIAVGPCLAQRQNDRPPKQQGQPQRQERQQHQPGARRAQPERRQNESARRPSQSNIDRASRNVQPNNNPNRPPSAYTPPPPKKFGSLNSQEKQKVLENDRRLEKLPPAQRQEMQDRGRVWSQLTPEQKGHIKNDVIPKWRQLPPNRQNAIQNRLAVLKNMPESARNQHLNDPNFTRGMSEEDKSMLRDLSHMHVGGAPEPPSE